MGHSTVLINGDFIRIATREASRMFALAMSRSSGGFPRHSTRDETLGPSQDHTLNPLKYP
jgi:hypothetical protein